MATTIALKTTRGHPLPPTTYEHSPQPTALHRPALAQQSCYSASHAPPLTTHAPPLTTHDPPLTTHAPPLTTHAPPLATHDPPLTTRSAAGALAYGRRVARPMQRLRIRHVSEWVSE